MAEPDDEEFEFVQAPPPEVKGAPLQSASVGSVASGTGGDEDDDDFGFADFQSAGPVSSPPSSSAQPVTSAHPTPVLPAPAASPPPPPSPPAPSIESADRLVPVEAKAPAPSAAAPPPAPPSPARAVPPLAAPAPPVEAPARLIAAPVSSPVAAEARAPPPVEDVAQSVSDDAADDWGSVAFESALPTESKLDTSPPQPAISEPPHSDVRPPVEPEASRAQPVATSSSTHAEATATSLSKPAAVATQPVQPPPEPAPPAQPAAADHVDDDDGFGDFETASGAPDGGFGEFEAASSPPAPAATVVEAPKVQDEPRILENIGKAFAKIAVALPVPEKCQVASCLASGISYGTTCAECQKLGLTVSGPLRAVPLPYVQTKAAKSTALTEVLASISIVSQAPPKILLDDASKFKESQFFKSMKKLMSGPDDIPAAPSSPSEAPPPRPRTSDAQMPAPTAKKPKSAVPNHPILQEVVDLSFMLIPTLVIRD